MRFYKMHFYILHETINDKVYTAGLTSFLKYKFYGKRGKLGRRRFKCEMQNRLPMSKGEFRDKSEHTPLTSSFSDNLIAESQAIT